MMERVAPTAEVMTPEQAASYLQVSRETVYRYIRQGRLTASRLGRSYRIPKRNLDLLLWESRTSELPLRQYTPSEIQTFFRADRLDSDTRRSAERLHAGHEAGSRSSLPLMSSPCCFSIAPASLRLLSHRLVAPASS